MTQAKRVKKLSRRDAIKLLGAVTGATVLANLPSKWKTPEIVKGVLPAHAQTSSLGLTILSCELNVNMSTGEFSSVAYFGPLPLPHIIPMYFTFTFVNTHVTGTAGAEPQPAYGTVFQASLTGEAGGIIPSSDNPYLDLIVPDSGATSGSVSIIWGFYYPADGTGTCSQTFNWAFPTVTTDSFADQSSLSSIMSASGEVTDQGSSPVIARGFVWSTSSNPTLANNVVTNGSGIGSFSSNFDVSPNGSATIYVRAYATNSEGTGYGVEFQAFNSICLAQGMLITLADGTTKKIEDIQYADNLLVWNFDEGKFDSALPLWIKKQEVTHQYNLLEFSDGSFLKTINQHRIFNKELGAFTYPMTEDTPIGTTTFNVKGEEVTLVNKSVVEEEEVNYYNVITDKYMNLFANGILTSCRYNNIYPIVDMKFVKDDRELISKEQYQGISDTYYEGLRLAEQNIPVEKTIAYVNRLELRKAPPQDLVSEALTNPEQFEAEPVL